MITCAGPIVALPLPKRDRTFLEIGNTCPISAVPYPIPYKSFTLSVLGTETIVVNGVWLPFRSHRYMGGSERKVWNVLASVRHS